MKLLEKKKPTTPSQRNLIRLNKRHLNKRPLIKKKIKNSIISSGRNNQGKITVRHKGGGHKKKYRQINFLRKTNSTGIVLSIEYDPNRNSSIAAVYDITEKNFMYILAPENLNIGDVIKSGNSAEENVGHAMPLSHIPVGSFVNSVSTKRNKPAQLSRSAGSFSKIKKTTMEYSIIELKSGIEKKISSECYATIGIVSNNLTFLTTTGKAGRSRWLNRRPTVRGVAMNPVDHPHGGGEGKKSGQGKSLWGKPIKKGFTSKSKQQKLLK